MRSMIRGQIISKEQEKVLVEEMIAFSLRVMKKDARAEELAILPLVLGLLLDR